MISLVLILAGVLTASVGVIKAMKSKFMDLDAMTWCWIGSAITVLGSSLCSLELK